MEYSFSSYVAIQEAMDNLNENKDAMALIKTFDGTSKNARGSFVSKAVSDLGMNSTTAGAYWQRNKKYAVGTPAIPGAAHAPTVAPKLSSDGMLKSIQTDTAKWVAAGQRALPQKAVKIGPLSLQTLTSTISVSGYFFGVENSKNGHMTGWVVFPDEGYVNKIWDNTRPVMKAEHLDDKMYAELRKSIPMIGDDLGIMSAGMMKIVQTAHETFQRNQDAGTTTAKLAASKAKDPWTKSVVKAYQTWLDAGQKVTNLEGNPTQDGYASTDGGGHQGKSYRFGLMNETAYRFVGVSVFPDEGYAFATDSKGKRSLPQRLTSELAKDLTDKIKNLGVALGLDTHAMLTALKRTQDNVENDAKAAKAAEADIKKFSILADVAMKKADEFCATAQRLDSQVQDENFGRSVVFQIGELRKSVAKWKETTKNTK